MATWGRVVKTGKVECIWLGLLRSINLQETNEFEREIFSMFIRDLIRDVSGWNSLGMPF